MNLETGIAASLLGTFVYIAGTSIGAGIKNAEYDAANTKKQEAIQRLQETDNARTYFSNGITHIMQDRDKDNIPECAYDIQYGDITMYHPAHKSDSLQECQERIDKEVPLRVTIGLSDKSMEALKRFYANALIAEKSEKDFQKSIQ